MTVLFPIIGWIYDEKIAPSFDQMYYVFNEF